MNSTDPADRSIRFNLRLSPDEKAACEDAQERMGGRDEISMNSVIAMLITEGYHYRVAAAGTVTVPVSETIMDAVRWTADELGITTATALEVLISRGLPHQPSPRCDHTRPGVPAPMPPARLRPSGPTLPDPGPRYATPRPSGLPPVPPVPGQDGIDIDPYDDPQETP